MYIFALYILVWILTSVCGKIEIILTHRLKRVSEVDFSVSFLFLFFAFFGHGCISWLCLTVWNWHRYATVCRRHCDMKTRYPKRYMTLPELNTCRPIGVRLSQSRGYLIHGALAFKDHPKLTYVIPIMIVEKKRAKKNSEWEWHLIFTWASDNGFGFSALKILLVIFRHRNPISTLPNNHAWF